MATFKELVEKDNELSKQMHSKLVELLKQHNGIIRTEDEDDKDRIYGIIYNGLEERYVETRILAVVLVGDDQVGIYCDNSLTETDLGEMTDEEIKADECYTFTIYGGMVYINATLTAICEVIEQYVVVNTL